MAASNECLRCAGRLEPGFVVDYGYGTQTLPKWFVGNPVRGWFGNLKLWRKPFVSVMTSRCQRCGLLESYAKVLSAAVQRSAAP